MIFCNVAVGHPPFCYAQKLFGYPVIPCIPWGLVKPKMLGQWASRLRDPMQNVCSSASTPGQADDLDHLSGSSRQDQSLFDQIDAYGHHLICAYLCISVHWLLDWFLILMQSVYVYIYNHYNIIIYSSVHDWTAISAPDTAAGESHGEVLSCSAWSHDILSSAICTCWYPFYPCMPLHSCIIISS